MADITITLNKEVSQEEMQVIESHISCLDIWATKMLAYESLYSGEFTLFYESMGGSRLEQIHQAAQAFSESVVAEWVRQLSAVESADQILHGHVQQMQETNLWLVSELDSARQAVEDLRQLKTHEKLMSGFLKAGKVCSLQDWAQVSQLTDQQRVASANTVWKELTELIRGDGEISEVSIFLLIACFELGYIPSTRGIPVGITKEFLDGIELTVVGSTCHNPRFAKKREDRVKSKMEEGLEAIKSKIPVEDKPVKTLSDQEVMLLVDQITMYRSVLAPRYTHLVSDHLRRVVGGKLNKALSSLQHHRHRHPEIIRQLHPSFFEMEVSSIRVDLSSVFRQETTVMDGVRELVELAGTLERLKSIWRNMRMINHTYRRESYETHKTQLDEVQAYFDELEYKSQSIMRHSDPTLKELNVPLLAYMFLVSEGIRLI